MSQVIISVLIALIPTSLCVVLFLQIQKQKKRIDQLTTGISGKNLEQLAEQFVQTLRKNNLVQQDIEAEFKKIRTEAATYLRKVGLVRFRAFDDTGGDQSFAIAVLDQDNSGFVISSLYGRDVSKVYSKEIEQGNSTTHKLTEEEQKAIAQAMNRT